MEDNKNINESKIPEEGASEHTDNIYNENAGIENKPDETLKKEVSSVETEDAKITKSDEITEDSDNAEKVTLQEIDYNNLLKTELLTELNNLINNYPAGVIKDNVEEIKVLFYKKHSTEKEEALKSFIDNGGIVEDFKFQNDDIEDTFKEVYNQYRDKKNKQAKKLEEEKKSNLKEKHQIIDEITELINKEESINKTFQEFRDLQTRWRDAGLVPQNEMKNLWESYHHTVEKFYDYININKELRDLDLKKNLEEKIKLCEKAESLLLEESITKAFKTLQTYHEKWRETGPVPRDQKDDIWERFKDAIFKINKKHQEYFDNLKEQ